MGIDKAWQHNPSSRLDDLAVVRQLVRDLVGPPDGDNRTALNKHPAVFDYREFAQLWPDPRTRRSGKRHELGGMKNSQ